MRKLIIIFVFAFISNVLWAQEYEWQAVRMDGSRTGCVCPSKDNVDKAVGVFKGGKYIAPNGTVYKRIQL